jgi:hypothetical protein
MPKKATVAPVVPAPAPAPEAPPAPAVLEVAPIDGQAVATDPPPKKEPSEKKKAALQKMFEGLKAKREQQRADAERESAEIKEERKQAKLKALAERKAARRFPPVAQYVTVRDLENFKNQLIQILPKTVYQEVPVDRIVPQPIAIPVETVREKVVQVVQPKKVTGNELLDNIFFR